MKVILFGYSSANAINRLASIMAQEENPIICDIRQSIKSERKPEWSGRVLQAQWKTRYKHIQALGNINFFRHGAPIVINDPFIGIPRLIKGLETGHTLILLCTCRDWQTCHRKVVLDLLLVQCPGIEVVY